MQACIKGDLSDLDSLNYRTLKRTNGHRDCTHFNILPTNVMGGKNGQHQLGPSRKGGLFKVCTGFVFSFFLLRFKIGETVSTLHNYVNYLFLTCYNQINYNTIQYNTLAVWEGPTELLLAKVKDASGRIGIFFF